MGRLIIDLGAVAQDKTGTNLRQGGLKINQNFEEVYQGILEESDSPDNPDEGYAILFPTPDGRVLLKDSEGNTKVVQRHKVYDGSDTLMPAKSGLKFSASFNVVEVGDNLTISLKSDIFDGFVETSEFDDLVTNLISTQRPDGDYKNPTQEEQETFIQGYLDTENYTKESDVDDRITTLRPDGDYKNPTSAEYETIIGNYINAESSTLKLLIDERVASQGYIKESEVDTKISNAIPNIEDLTTHVDNEISAISNTVTGLSNDVTLLNDFKNGIEFTIDSRVSATVGANVSSLTSRIEAVEDSVDEVENLKGKIAAALGTDPAYFRNILNAQEAE